MDTTLFAKYMKQLEVDGYVVIKNVVSAEKAEDYASRFWDYLESLSVEKKIDRNNPKSLVGEHWISTLHGIIKNYNIGHAQFVWDVRDEDNIVSIFEQYWKTRDLLVSFDGACIIRPSAGGSRSKWAHVDEAPVLKIKEKTDSKFKEVRNFPCVQGFLNLKPCGPNDGGLVVWEGSHKGHDQFFVDKGDMNEEERKKYGIKKSSFAWKDHTENWYKFDEDNQVDAAHLKKYNKKKVCCDAGDFVMWYSKTVHYAEAIDSKINTNPSAHRMCVYVCMLPKKYATENDLKKKKKALQELRTTSHWPCIKLKLNPLHPRTYGNEKMLTNFILPTTYPTLTDRMKKLAGVASNFSFSEQKGIKRKLEK